MYQLSSRDVWQQFWAVVASLQWSLSSRHVWVGVRSWVCVVQRELHGWVCMPCRLYVAHCEPVCCGEVRTVWGGCVHRLPRWCVRVDSWCIISDVQWFVCGRVRVSPWIHVPHRVSVHAWHVQHWWCCTMFAVSRWYLWCIPRVVVAAVHGAVPFRHLWCYLGPVDGWL